MTTADGRVLGTTKIVDHGSVADRWNLVLLGDGYRLGEMTQFHTDVDAFVTAMRSTPPYDQLWAAINIYRVDVASNQSGADIPFTNPPTVVATYFDAAFDSVIQRLLQVTDTTAFDVVDQQLPHSWSQVAVIVNTPIYGGADHPGGGVATFSTDPSSAEIGLHELGHAFGLADEYAFLTACNDLNWRRGPPEPAEPNVTLDTNPATIKWRHLIQPGTPTPTTQNPDPTCALCDQRLVSPFPAGTVGAFEGARYFHCDAYRPEFDCRMRTLGRDYCAVCLERIQQSLAPFLVQPSVQITDIWTYSDFNNPTSRRNFFRWNDPFGIGLLVACSQDLSDAEVLLQLANFRQDPLSGRAWWLNRTRSLWTPSRLR